MRFKIGSLLALILLGPACGPVLLYSITITPVPNAPLQFPHHTVIPLAATGNYTDGSSLDLTAVVTWSCTSTTAAVISATGDLTTAEQGTILITADDGLVQGNVVATVIGGGSDLYIQVFQTAVGIGNNAFTLTSTGDLPPTGTSDPTEAPGPSPSGAWNLTGVQPKGFTTWVRAVAKDESFNWVDVSGAVTWTLNDPGGTGTTLDTSTRRVTSGSLPGTVTISAVLSTFVHSSPQSGTPKANGEIRVADATLSSLTVNPADNSTAGDPHFGPDPIYVAVGHHVPAKVTGTFTGPDAGGYSITWDCVLTSNNTLKATVDSGGEVFGISAGTATVTAKVGLTITDTIPVNVGAPEVDYVEVLPPNPTLAASGGVSAQLTALAHFSDGTTLDVTTNPNTVWSIASGSGVSVSSTGLATPTGSAGEFAQVRACYTSTYVTPAGVSGPLVACSNSGDALQTAPPFRDVNGATVNLNSVVTLN